MKNMNKLAIYLVTCVMLTCACRDSETIGEDQACKIINHGNVSGPELDQNEELPGLEDVYDQFETHVRNKDIDGLNGIFLHNSAPLFIVGKKPTGIQSVRLDGAGFRNYVTNTPGLELRISNTDFRIKKGVAVSWANYEEVTYSGTTATGVDLFFYINTESGWKLTTTNNTFVNPGDNTDYEAKYAMHDSPAAIIPNLVTAFNEKDESAWLDNFRSQSTFMVLSSEFSESFSNSAHTTEAFIDCVTSDSNEYTLSITNAFIEIKDYYLAMVLANYSIGLEGEELESGEIVLTMIGTPNGGWKISAGALTY